VVAPKKGTFTTQCFYDAVRADPTGLHSLVMACVPPPVHGRLPS
jgi:hypothetical protein